MPEDQLRASDVPASMMPEIEALHVKDVYDNIAKEWHGTRYKSWPRVEEFVLSLPRGSLVADLGCGNGKMASACRRGGHFALGCDFSIELVRISAFEQSMEVRRKRRPIHGRHSRPSAATAAATAATPTRTCHY